MKRISLIVIIILTIVTIVADQKAYSQQEVIDLRLKDADLVDVIKMLSERGGYNIVTGSDVSGKVTLDLHNVTVDEALNAALKINGYGIEKIGKIMFVRPSGTIKDLPEEVPPLQLRSYRVTYIDAAEILPVLQQNITKYGKVSINKSNNVIIVEDTEENIKKIEKIIKEVDINPRQVLIEAKILEIRLNDDTQLGVDWSQVFKSGKASMSVEGKNFTLPSSTGTPGLFFSAVTPHFQMFLDALRERGDLKTLATPRLIALDNKESQIIIGGRLGYRVTTTINQVTTESVEFLDIGTMLRITPRIGDNGNIYLRIYPKISDGVITQGLPSETTTEVTTEVLVKDGESVFIGGLIRDRKEKVRKQIPILGDIPILGHLFGRTTETLNKAETIILITPHIK